VVHDGGPTTSRGFRKRVVYLDQDVFAPSLIGAAVDGPLILDDGLRRGASTLDDALVLGDDLRAESALALVVERLTWHLAGRPPAVAAPEPGALAQRAREILDADPAGVSRIADVAASLGVSSAHLVRSFTRSYGIPPHRYLLGRRLDLARRRLLDGQPPAEVAIATGFYDQSHLGRHFDQLLATTPGRYRTRTPATGTNDAD
jgi:AraC-like DNA-binding protein